MISASGSRLLVTGVMMSKAHSRSSLGCARSSFLGRNTRSMLYLEKREETHKDTCVYSQHEAMFTCELQQVMRLATLSRMVVMHLNIISQKYNVKTFMHSCLKQSWGFISCPKFSNHLVCRERHFFFLKDLTNMINFKKKKLLS